MRVLGAAVVLVLLAIRPAAAQSSCSVTRQNLFVRDALEELYLWYRDLPLVDPVRYDSPEVYLDAVRSRPIDAAFSYITSRAANDAFYAESRYHGFGLATAMVDGALRVLQVFEGGPAAEAGLARGLRIAAVDGVTVAALAASGALARALDGEAVTLDVAWRDEPPWTVTLRRRAVVIPTVSLTQVLDVDGRKVGYLHFRNFVEPSPAALDGAFAALAAAGVTELVLDLRYNGGGLVSVATHLASLVGGARTAGQVFVEYRHNDRNRRRDETLRFTAPAHALGLARVLVIATPATASASELVINGLRPFVPVVVVGGRTYGKPVGQYSLPFCDKVLAPVAFASVNADGEGGYYAGIAADCPAADDLDHALGDAGEASLAEALTYVRTGACSAAAPAPAADAATVDRTRESGGAAMVPRPGWATLLNAQ